MNNKYKEDMLLEIEKKLKKKKEKSALAIDPKDYRSAVFDFFKNFEENRVGLTGDALMILFDMAQSSLKERLSILDNRCKVQFHPTQDGNIQGVTIIWTPAFAKQNNIDQQIYVDVSDMLLF